MGKPTKADGTRWVPHLLRALKILLDKNFSVLVSHFEHTAEARDSSAIMQGRAKNVTKKLKSYKLPTSFVPNVGYCRRSYPKFHSSFRRILSRYRR